LQKVLGSSLDGFAATVCLHDDEDPKAAAYSLDKSSCRRIESVAGHGYEATCRLAASMEGPSRALSAADPELLAELGYREPVLLLPFISREKLIGFLALHGEQGSFDDDAVRFVQSLAQEAKVSLQNALLFRKVERLSWTDPLTGVKNRRSFSQIAEPVLLLAERHNRPLSAAMLDLDFFKKVNDTYGHGTGDDVLRGVAAVLVNTIRSSDIVGRYGGEEFCFVFPETDIETAGQLLERIRKAVAVLQFSGGEKLFSITASIGAAKLAGSGETLDRLLFRCDQALYRAKESGRNRCITSC
ncbi:MAG: sensor domain-containing diguanylate cyclase, partial [bacterium]